ncbi:MAG TPA: response regulator transcription factor [Sporichthyaceae bacterium]|nr:response regulator transcription factor [Sporichthyaceae bacterium]
MARLLLIDDDEAIARRVVAALTATGHHVVWQRTGAKALIEAAHSGFDLVLLDLGLPDRDAVEVCRDLRVSQPGCVLVMLADRRDEMDAVIGLDAGADDYLAKPFGMVELVARIHAHLRRASAGRTVAGQVFIDGDLVVDLAARRCSVGGQEALLRAKEFDLLVRLVRSAGQAVSRQTLMADVWDENWSGSTKTLDVHVASVRRRLATAARMAMAARVPSITTLRGHGYRFDPLDAHD